MLVVGISSIAASRDDRLHENQSSFWSLALGASLDVGAWLLEFLPAAAPKDNSAPRTPVSFSGMELGCWKLEFLSGFPFATFLLGFGQCPRTRPIAGCNLPV